MDDPRSISSRKQDHIRINLEKDVSSGLTTGLETLRFEHQALPEVDLEEVNLSQTLFGRLVKAPILISSMTGGTRQGLNINAILAMAAQATGLAMGLGSQRAAIEHPAQGESFRIRQYAPDILLFANLGAVQLNYGYGADQCRAVVDMAEADALILHLNPLQEALQPEGDTRFSGLLRKIEAVCRELTVPVVVKEVGWGISGRAARQLYEAGVTAIDVAGAGGTSWSQVEMHRMNDESRARVALAFRSWGLTTVESILAVREAAPEGLVFASGGLRDGIDIAKCIALGASLGGMAGPFLRTAASSVEDTVELIEEIKSQIQICMFAAGVRNLEELGQAKLISHPDGAYGT